MPVKRKWAEGVRNIVRFNWPFFAGSGLGASILLGLALTAPLWIALIAALALLLLGLAILIPLIVSFYVYDLSGLYRMSFLKEHGPESLVKKVVNLTAGLDETTPLLQATFPGAKVLPFDFFDPAKHREPSIRRARKLFPPHPSTRAISTSHLPLPDDQTDLIIGFLSLHEIRNENERIDFLNEIQRILAPQGKLFVVEHLRDLPNFLAYSIGFFHFHSRATWHRDFAHCGLTISKEQRLTPFLRLFELTSS